MVSAQPKRLIVTADEARRLHNGETVEVRRAMQPQPRPKPPKHITTITLHPLDNGSLGFYDAARDYVCPYAAGSRWWVAEAHFGDYGDEIYYLATAIDDGLLADEIAEIRWHSAATMPRRASRTNTESVACRVELKDGTWYWVASMRGSKA
jgi:hypothetical protein